MEIRHMQKFMIAAASLFAASSASAGEFTGPWVDARGGFDSVQLVASGNGANVSASRSGFSYGLAAGYDFATGGKAIAGLQIGGHGSTAQVCDAVFGNDEACLKAGRDFEVLARVGVKASPTLLIYGLAGYANGRISATYVDFINAANDDRASDNGGGIRVGAGIEQSFGKMFAKAEYRYTSYDKTDLGFGVDAGFNRHQVLGSIGFRF
jgi:outer membrane immunogenic protein